MKSKILKSINRAVGIVTHMAYPHVCSMPPTAPLYLKGGDIMKFEIFQDKKKQYRFRLIANNNQVVCQSEAYVGKDSCKKGIAAVKKCGKAKVEDMTI